MRNFIVAVLITIGSVTADARETAQSFENGRLHVADWYAHNSIVPDPNGGTIYRGFMVRPSKAGLELWLGRGYGAIYESRRLFSFGAFRWTVKFAGLKELSDERGGVFSPHLYRPWDGVTRSQRAEVDFEFMRCKDGRCTFSDMVHLAVHSSDSYTRIMHADCVERFCTLGIDWTEDRVVFSIDDNDVATAASPAPPVAVRLMSWAGKPSFGGRHPEAMLPIGVVKEFSYERFGD